MFPIFKKISVYVVAYNIKHDPPRSYFLSLVSKVLNKKYVKVVKRHSTLGFIVPLASIDMHQKPNSIICRSISSHLRRRGLSFLFCLCRLGKYVPFLLMISKYVILSSKGMSHSTECSFFQQSSKCLWPHALPFEHLVDFFDGLWGTLHCSKIGQNKVMI